ncbi:MAG: MetS family NSS transporter small subunit [Desulfonatronovibrionaceae bacterium]
MSFGAILMMVLGLGVTWGGAAICLHIALKSRRA